MDNKKKLYLKNGIKILLFAGILTLGKYSITKCSQINEEERIEIEEYEREKEYQKEDVIIGDNLEEIEGTEKIFEPGEHIILKSIGDKDTYDDYQIQSIEGYSILGVCNARLRGMQILYINDVEVEAKATSLNEETGTYYYQNFGSPTNLEKEEDAKILIKK